MALIRFVLAGALVLSGLSGQDEPVSATQEALEKAQALLAAGKPDEAVPLMETAVAARPGDAAGLAGLAAAYAAVGDPRAEAIFKRAIGADRKNLVLRVAFAEYLWRDRRYDEGNAVMERVIAAAPGNPRLKAHYGVNLAEQGRFLQASAELDAARRGGLDSADVLFYLGSALWEVGRLEEAQEQLRQAVLRAPEKVAARHRLGRLLLLRGKPVEAAEELSRAARLAPESAEAALDLGRALEATGKTAEADASYRRALELEPGLSVTHYALGTLLARAGRRDEAEKHIALYREYFQKEQDRRFRAGSRQAELNLGWTQLHSGRAEAALAQFSRHPDDVEALRGAAAALEHMRRHAEAVRLLERALLLDPGNRVLRFELDREREKAKTP